MKKIIQLLALITAVGGFTASTHAQWYSGPGAEWAYTFMGWCYFYDYADDYVYSQDKDATYYWEEDTSGRIWFLADEPDTIVEEGYDYTDTNPDFCISYACYNGGWFWTNTANYPDAYITNVYLDFESKNEHPWEGGSFGCEQYWVPGPSVLAEAITSPQDQFDWSGNAYFPEYSAPSDPYSVSDVYIPIAP